MFSKQFDQLNMGTLETVFAYLPFWTLPKYISNLLDEVTSYAVDAL